MTTFEVIALLLLGAIIGLFFHLIKKLSKSKNNEDDIEKYEKIQKILNSVVDRSTEAQKELFNQKTGDLVKAVDTHSKELNDSLNSMTTNIEGLDKMTENMKLEIDQFSKVLGADSSLSGRFGQWQLKNLFDYHNLKENVDYMLEVVAKTQDGKQYRPDAILISNEKCLVVDSKATANLGETIKELLDDDTSKERKAEIKKDLKDRVSIQAKDLAKKEYQNLIFEGKYTTPDFVIMFIPNENVYFSVKELISKDSNMIEEGVLLVGPDNMNFIILMWAHINGVLKVQCQVEEIKKAASAIHNHFSNTSTNLESLRKAIDATVERWNVLVGNVDKRLIPSVKKLEEMGVKSSKEITEPSQINTSTRSFEKLRVVSSDKND
ncbi:MAG: DNA recombination protein RmuC [Thermodesulfobacteriota bacterium]|nr:DNA recombination protein RmuC [Thermodesulfobacteriota bacterium]